jgi:hypothetical protein
MGKMNDNLRDIALGWQEEAGRDSDEADRLLKVVADMPMSQRDSLEYTLHYMVSGQKMARADALRECANAVFSYLNSWELAQNV